ncbi:murein transglycosylase domain-containing protein [Hydrogenovibrio sp. 3SP14C1]|uniref:murein transglycosylase domain-containing protein n=1 Tax=Hydrogenovibrio sp. 3SP14C1 TaxID=3038774 RepID=UPI0024179EE8|nr:murein transglycosylase domain-containing protein [Hydrogenovibrio sp. 3SP14C1]MDG4812937.1 murein transglycosylase domain-containing protein [Hydrogenovibrio sp. 3SP14C1]
MSFHKTISYLIVASMILLGVSSGLMVSFEQWVIVQTQAKESTPSMHLPVESGIRHMVSSMPKKQTAVEPFKAKPNTGKSKINDPFQPSSSLGEKQNIAHSSNQSSSFKPTLVNLSQIQSATRLHPVLVIYKDELVIEFPKAIASTKNIKNAVSRVLLLSHPLSDHDLLSKDSLVLSEKPYFYRRALDQHKQPIRYPKQAFDYASYLIEHHAEEIKDEEGEFIALHIPLVESGLTGPAKNYQAWVKDYADEFDVPPSLVYAVMETESAFNPRAVSRSNAIGLMQLKPEAAGRDVYQYIDAKPGQPSQNDLFDSKNNIRMGTAYLSLLKHDYLSNIVDDKIKQMVTISSYNGGLTTVLGLFGNTPEKAVERLNKMKPNQVYRKLRYDHQSDETRRYLDKVLKAETKYRALLNEV